MKAFRHTLIYLAVCFASFTLYSSAQDFSADFVPGEILVKFKPGTGKSQKDNAIKDVIDENTISEDVVKDFKIVPGLRKISSNLDTQMAISILGKNPNVEYAEPDYILTADIVPNDTSFNTLWGLNDVGDSSPDNDINGPEAWDIFTGAPNQVIAIIDSGVDYNHPDLNDNMWVNPGEIPGDGIDNDGNGYIDDIHGYDFYNNDPNPFDDNSHGTHVAGTVCAEGNNNLGVVGVNWQCKIMALKFLGSGGSGTTAGAILAIQYADDMGVKISNNSWGGGGSSQALSDAIQNAALNNGHIFVAAAGNNNNNTDNIPHYPSSYNLDNIISVASTTDSGDKSSFSNYGVNTVDLGAPGSSINSTSPGGGYSIKSGTSMATPHVAGVVALVYGYMSQINPNINYQAVIQTIYNNVRPLSSMNGITVTGGIVDAYSSLASIPITPQCDDGEDNDSDGLIDYPNDPDCVESNDNDESPDICCFIPPPPVGGTCSGQCGGQAPSGCWCDNLCNGFGDCCSEVCTDCSSLNFCDVAPPPPTPEPTPPPTPEPTPPPVGGACSGQCGGQAPSGCWCDNLCNGFGDCCSEVCTDCSSLNFCSN